MKKAYSKMMDFFNQVANHHVGAYAAQSAYFFMLSLIPIILLLLTMVRYTPLTKADVMTAVLQLFPETFDSLIVSVVNQVYNQSMAIVPITVLVALWGAGKGVLAMTTGLNMVYECFETRNYIWLRIRASVYTVLFVLMIILYLILPVFGNLISRFIASYIPILVPVANKLIELRIIIAPAALIGFCLLLYKFLPNRKITMKRELPGAVFAALGWMVVSWVFSVYLNIFSGFSTMYGSLTTIVILMLWLYFCMYSILLGGEVNKLMYDKMHEKEKRERSLQETEE